MPNDGDIPRHTNDGAGVDPLGVGLSIVIELLNHAAIDMDGLAVAWAHRLPGVPIPGPSVRLLHLLPINEGLAEEAEFIVDAVTNGREVQGAEGIEETSGKATQPTISETHIRLFVEDFCEVLAQFTQRRFGSVVEACVAEIIFQQTAHQILQGKVMQAAHPIAPVKGAGVGAMVEHPVTHGQACGHPPIAGRGGFNICTKGEAEVIGDGGLESCGVIFQGGTGAVWMRIDHGGN